MSAKRTGTLGAVAEMIAAEVIEPTAEGIAAAISTLVRRGDLVAGERLPTVRALATDLGVSTSLVSDAWRRLQQHGVVITDRRRGTTVRTPRHEFGPRYWQVPVAPGTFELDLSTGTPDPSLLPPVGPVLHRIHADVTVGSYVDRPVLEPLEAAIRDRLPFESEGFTLVDGALDALDRTVGQVVGLGSRVLVEDPTFPPLIDMLELAGAEVVPIPLDGNGADPRVIEAELASTRPPDAIFVQPRAHNPTGTGWSAKRAKEIARLVKGSSTMVVEDDHSGDACLDPIRSIGAHAPANVVHVRSFSKSHGPDLRIAAIAAPATFVDRLVRRRQLGPSWTSRLLQQILLSMLLDERTDRTVAIAAERYAERRSLLRSLLADRGVEMPDGAGLNMWVPVANEQVAVVSLAAQGVGVAPGTPFRIIKSDDDFLRISIGTLPDETARIATLADRIAHAATGRRP